MMTTTHAITYEKSLGSRSGAMAERLEAGARALAALAATLSSPSGRRAFPKTAVRLASWFTTWPACIRSKWLYAPLEAGCALVRNPADLRNAFSYHPAYYNFEEEAINYYDIGPQNSRGFRALKVWLALQHAGAAGYREMIQDDITLARYLYDLAAEHPDLEALTNHLSITTLRFVPREMRNSLGSEPAERYLNDLNQRLLTALEKSGEAFCSNAVIAGRYALRFCIVNFRASTSDIEAIPQLIVRLGRQIQAGMNRSMEQDQPTQAVP
jgi:glutamate/tyrosine decarboxylase-like PLP-dependent enzyme